MHKNNLTYLINCVIFRSVVHQGLNNGLDGRPADDTTSTEQTESTTWRDLQLRKLLYKCLVEEDGLLSKEL